VGSEFGLKAGQFGVMAMWAAQARHHSSIVKLQFPANCSNPSD